MFISVKFQTFLIIILLSVTIVESSPNILFILADDLRADAVGFDGNDIVQTPIIDSLARQGVIFDSAYVTTPICAISRACILTGQYSIRNEVGDFHTPINLRDSYPYLLQKNGYYTGFMGKWGIHAGNKKYMTKVAKSFDFWAGCYNQSNFFHEETCRWVQHDGVRGRGNYLCDCPPDRLGRKGEEVRTGFANMKNPIHLETVIFPRKMEMFLQSRDKFKPFCMSISYKSPHAPFQDWDRRFKDLHSDEIIPLKPTATLEAAAKQPQFLQDSLESDLMRDWLKSTTINLWYRHYYRLIAGLDFSIGKICRLLKKYGVMDNTVIIFISDNGLFMGEHGFGGKWLLYEESIRVPCFIYDPRLPKEKRGKVSSELVLNVDMYRTIADLAGVKVNRKIQGKSLVPLLSNPNKKLREGSFFEHHFTLKAPHIIAQSEGYRNSDWKYIRYTEQNPIVEQLFDMQKDILEEHNLSDNPEHQQKLNQLRSSWQRSRLKASGK